MKPLGLTMNFETDSHVLTLDEATGALEMKQPANDICLRAVFIGKKRYRVVLDSGNAQRWTGVQMGNEIRTALRRAGFDKEVIDSVMKESAKHVHAQDEATSNEPQGR
jgi:hypothetical protein